MPIYTGHAPPLRADDAAPDPARFAFVRDGFAVWAFLFTPLWMLLHRLWLVLTCYVALSVTLAIAMVAIGASAGAEFSVAALISLLAGLEAGTLRRFTLSRRGWKNLGIVSGYDREDAERRFFETWRQQAPSPQVTPAVSPPAASSAPAAPLPRLPQAPGVIGLFPEPGAQR